MNRRGFVGAATSAVAWFGWAKPEVSMKPKVERDRVKEQMAELMEGVRELERQIKATKITICCCVGGTRVRGNKENEA